MAGYKKRAWVKPATPPNSEINVTPLVDVVLVLLIIFMVVTPLMEKDLEVRIPEVEKPDVEMMPPDNTQIVVKLEKDGSLSINTKPQPADQYVAELKKMLMAKRKDDEKVVFFVADDGANYGKLITAIDGAKQAGAVVVGMATEDIPEAGGAAPAPAPEGAPQ